MAHFGGNLNCLKVLGLIEVWCFGCSFFVSFVVGASVRY